MSLQLKCVIIIIAIFLVSSTDACTFINLPIDPISSEKYDIYLGSTEIIEVRFNNEKREGIIEIFPESPLTVTNRKLNNICLIEGGIWVRKDVYVSDDNLVILTHEYSGSTDMLNFYDTRSCKKIGHIDVSNAAWKLEKSNILVIRQDTTNWEKSRKPTIYPLTKYCLQS